MSCPALHKGIVALFLLCGLAAPGFATPEKTELLIVDLVLNGQPAGDAFVLRANDGEFLLAETSLTEWQIVRPWPTATSYRNSRYYSLADFAGAESHFNERTLELSVSIPAALLPLRNVGLQRSVRGAHIEDVGAYLDYDVNWLADSRTGNETLYSLFRPVVFGEFGNVAANLTYRDYSEGNVFGDRNTGSGLNVLELTYTRDDPENMRSLRVGDVFTRPSAHGRAIRMGGIQFGTNFDTQPTFIRYPLPSFYGETSVPSALDVYINGQLRRSEDVQAGRYVLEDIPAVNGAGQMQIVTRDALGRQQVYAQDFYLATDLLREGLSDYSINIGALREDFALDNFQYGKLAGSATWRYGLRSNLTVESHLEFTDGVAMLGGAAQRRLDVGGVANLALGVSNGRDGTGVRWQAGYRQQSTLFSFNVDLSGASRDFAVVGHYEEHPEFQALTSLGKNLYDYGSLGVSVIHQGFHKAGSRTIFSATHSKTFANFLSMSTFISVINAESNDVTGGIRFSMPFGDRHSGGGGVSAGRGNARVEAEFRRSVPVGTGYGYHVGVSASDDSFVDAGMMLQNDWGRYSADVRSSSAAGDVWELGASGSVAYLSGMTSFTRQIRDAFAVVNVGGLEGVRVYKENQVVGRTDENGQIFIPALRPYLGNQLRIELDDLPLNARIGNTKTETTPYYRSGVVVNFDVSLTTNVILRAVRQDGSVLPEGSLATVVQTGELFPVGMDGKLYLQGIDRSSQIEIRSAGDVCHLNVPYPASVAVITDVGEIVCRPGVAE